MAFLAIALLLPRCNSVIREADGDGQLTVLSGNAVGVSQADVSPGEIWTAGSLPLCKRNPEVDATLLSITPVREHGQVEVIRVGVRSANPPETPMIGLEPGMPDDVRSPDGYEVPTSCRSEDAALGEIIVSLKKTGSGGGWLRGLRLRYESSAKVHEFVVRFTFGLCGNNPRVPSCDGN